MRKLSLLVMVLAAMVLAVPAQATMVKGTSGEVVFLDDYEADTEGTSPSAPQVGSWSPSGASFIRDIGTAPGPFEGDQYLKVNTTANLGVSDLANLASTVTGPGTIHVETKFYFPVGNPDTSFIFALRAADVANIASLSNTGNQITDLANGENYGLFFTPGTWHTLELDYVLNSLSLTVTLNGTPATFPVRADRARNNVAQLDIRGLISLDAVPEPASLALLGLGGLMMLKRQRKSA